MATPEPEIISVEAAGSDVRLRWSPGSPDSPWELSSQPDWDRVEGIRLVSAAFDDGAALGVVTVRPRDARGHGDDSVAARLRDADGIHTASTEALISVEYDPARLPRRLGIELWPESDSPPFRIAADRGADDGHHEAGGRTAVPMIFRLDGIEGRGLYETLRRG
jgi:hypothetical protein